MCEEGEKETRKKRKKKKKSLLLVQLRTLDTSTKHHQS
jgi:hypothetical protein